MRVHVLGVCGPLIPADDSEMNDAPPIMLVPGFGFETDTTEPLDPV
jgi:hypothetical protein